MKDELIVFVRIALYIVTGRALAGGWIPEDVANELTSPATVEAITALILGALTALWYWLSKSRRALKQALH